jgi:hypothetical protein
MKSRIYVVKRQTYEHRELVTQIEQAPTGAQNWFFIKSQKDEQI